MTLPRRDRFASREVLRHFLQDLPRALRELECSVVEVLDSSWDEPFRRRAHEMATALADASSASGLSDLGALLRAIASLLRLRLEDALAIQPELRRKLLELLGILKELRLRFQDPALE